MWLQYFTVFIFMVVMIRLILIMTGDMSAQQKVSKAGNWIVGVVLLIISWNVLNVIFPNVNIGRFNEGDAEETNEKYEQKEFDRTKSDQDSTTVKIKFRGDK